MFCKNCGKEIDQNTKFCNHCGAPQESDASSAVANANQAPAPKKNNSLKLIIVAAVVAVCFAIGALVIAPSMSKSTNDNNQTSNTSQTQTEENNAVTEQDNTSEEKTLTAIDGGYNTGKMFLSDLGEYGNVALSVGYNKENGVVRQVSAVFTITVRHSEYASMKSNFEIWEQRISNGDDKYVEASYTELSDSVSFVIGISCLNEADRAERVALAEEILDFVANEQDCAFYIDDLTALLVDTYGFTVQE